MKTRTIAAITSIATSAVLLLTMVLPGSAATISWNNPAGGNWNVAANWLPNAVPGAGDLALITNSGTYTVTLNSSPTVAGLTLGASSGGGTQTLDMNGRTLALNGPFTVNSRGAYTLDSGTLAGNTNAVLTGTFGWTAGALAGTLTLASGSTLNITTGNSHNLPNCTLTNRGTVLWSGGLMQGGGGSPGTVIYNNGLWDSQGDLAWNYAFGGNGTTFNNAGTFRKSASAGSYTIFHPGAVFNNTGNLDSQTNFIYLNGGGNLTGGTAINQVGFVGLNAGAFNLNGTVTSSNVQMLGTATLTGNNVINGALNWIVGDWNSSASETIATNSTLYITSGNVHNLLNCTVTNNGTVVWANGTIQGGGSPGTLIVNNGVWDAQSDQTWNYAYGGNGTVFNNRGTFRKSGGAGKFTGNTYFTGGVVFNQLAGVIDLQQNGTNGTQLALLGGGSFSGGYVTTNTQGLLNLAAGGYNLNGTVTGTNTWQNGGILVGDNVIKGALTWIVGNWDNSASETIATNSTLLITSANVHNLSNCTVTNNGTVVWANGTIQGGGTPGTRIVNNGVWDAQSDQTWNYAYGGNGTVFNNYGTFRKSGGASEFANASILAGGVVFNQLAGMIDVQNGTNGLQLAFQGGGNFTGGYITTNQFGLTVLSVGSFNLNGTVTGTNTWQNNGNLVGTNVINGTLTWVGGVWNNAVVTIPANSTVIVNGGGGLNDLNAAVVTNSGTLKWVSGQLRGGNGATVYNYGLWDAQSDQQFNSAFGGATIFNNFGTFRKSGGAGMGPTYTLITGGVLFNQLAGMIDVQNGTNGLELAFQGGGNFTGGYITTNQSGLTVLSVGGFNLNGTVTGTNTWENNGNLVGTNVIKGALTWVGGLWNGAVVTIATNSTVIVAGGGGLNDMPNCVVTNNGTVAWASGQIRGNGGTFIYNYGLWEAQSDQQLNAAYGAGTVFNNFGTCRKSAGTGNTVFVGGVLFNQIGGLLSVPTGSLYLQGGGNLTGGSVTSSDTGTIYLNAGSFNINGAATSGNVVQNAGNLVGTNVINGTLTWVAGNWNGAAVTIAPNSTVTVAGGGGLNDLPNCIVINNGTVAWASGQIRGNGGTFIYNYGLWEAQSDQQLNAAYGAGTVFNNFGTFRKELTTGTTAIAGGVTFNNTGKLDAQNGNISLQGAYTLAHGTQMGFGLGGLFGNGSISLPGAATFAGSLSVNLNGNYWPAPGTSFNLLHYTSETGILFTNTALPPSFSWQTSYQPTVFTLTVLVRPAVTNTTPTDLVLSTLNGTHLYLGWPGDHTGWSLQAQTNSLRVGLSNHWATVPNSWMSNEFVMPIVKTNPAVFFRLVYP